MVLAELGMDASPNAVSLLIRPRIEQKKADWNLSEDRCHENYHSLLIPRTEPPAVQYLGWAYRNT